MKIGDKFSSFEEFLTVFSKYKKNVLNEYSIRDARTIENQKKRNPDTVKNINTDLKYYYIRYACVKGGRIFKSKNENSTTSTMKQDCEATLFLKVSACKQFLNIIEINDSHNHTSTKSYFTYLTQQRLKLLNNMKKNEIESFRDGANKNILDKIKNEASCKLTLKDLKRFEECINMLKDVYECTDVELLVDETNVFKGLYFQDERMKKYFEAFPEILFIDGTHCLVDLLAATYLIMVEDGNGLSEIVAVCLLVDENQKSINFFIETFKNRNKNCDKVQVVMSNKDKTERKVFSAQFPHSKLLICLFNVFQNFNRDISVKKMDITANEMRLSKEYLQKLVYAPSESKYEEYYNEMIENVPELVKQYYDCNWGCIKEQFVQYLTLQNLYLGNKTNNGFECINSKLKNVNKNSTLEDFLQNFFVLINSSRGEKDTKNLQMLNKKLANPENETENLYHKYLTNFAFEKLRNQLKIVKYSKEFIPIGNDNFLADTSEGQLRVTPTSCECLFRKSLQLPCRHIFKCRYLLSLPLFDTDLCLDRWTRTYCEKIFENLVDDESSIIQNRDNIIKVNKIAVQPKCVTNLKKFKLMNDQGKIMAQLSSEVAAPIFFERLNIMKTITKYWSEGKDSILLDILKTNIPEIEKHTESSNQNLMMSEKVLESENEEREDELEYLSENEFMDIDYEGHFIANPNLENSFVYNDHQKLEERLIPSITDNHQSVKSEEAFMETQLHPVDPDVKLENTTLPNYENFDAIYIKEEPLEENPQDGELYENVLDSIKNEEYLTVNNKHSDIQSENPVIEDDIRETENTNSNSFYCDICNKSFTLKSNLIKHIKRHNGIKDFQCPVCKKLFTQNSHLKSHMKGHTGIKEYQCPTCNKSFTYNSNLKTHMKMHTGAKDYKCTVCNKLFTFNSALYNHMKIHTRSKEH